MSEKDILLKEETILGLNEHIRIRREKSSIIVYWAEHNAGVNERGETIDTSGNYCFTSSVAMMLALFDGKRSLKEVFQMVQFIWEEPSLTFVDLCKELEKFILNVPPLNIKIPVLIEVTEDKKQKFIHYDPEDFVIKGDKFLPQEATVLQFPITTVLMPTLDCVTDCVYCYMGRHLAPKYSFLPFSRWKELLDEMGEYQLSGLGFAGGDPMCYEHTIDMLEIASTFNPPVHISVATKSYISQEVARRLSHISDLEFQISLDSTVPKIADAMTRKKGYCKQAIESIKNLMAAGVNLAVKAVVTPLNIQSMPQTILDLHNLGVKTIRATIYVRSVWHHKDELFNKMNEWEEYGKQVEEIEAKHGFKIIMQGGAPAPEINESQGQNQKSWNERNECTVGKKQVVILPDGSLIGCEQLPQTPECFLGNVAKDSLYNVWNSESFKTKSYDIPMEKYKGTVCYNCKEFEGCHSANGKGYCMRESYRIFGTIYAPCPGCPYNDKKPPRMQ